MLTQVNFKPTTKQVKETVVLDDGTKVTRVKKDANDKIVREVSGFSLIASVEDEDGNADNLNLATVVNTLDRAAKFQAQLYGEDDPSAAMDSQRADAIHTGMVAKAEEFKAQLSAKVNFAASRQPKKAKASQQIDAGQFEIA